MGRTLRVLLGLFLAFCLALAAVPAVAADRPASSRVVTFATEISVANIGRTPVRQCHLQVPLLAAISSPYQRILSETFDPAPVEVVEDEDGRRAHFVLPPLAPGSRLVILVTYELALQPFSLDTPPQAAVADLGAWLGSETGVEADHPDIVALAASLTRGRTGRQAARAIFTAVTERLTYDLAAVQRETEALVALRTGKGACGDYSRLFVALARAAGIPARLVNGYARDGAPLGPDLSHLRHTWAEFYLDGQGWVPVDATFGRFAELAAGTHLVQNYRDEPLRGAYAGGELRITVADHLSEK